MDKELVVSEITNMLSEVIFDRIGIAAEALLDDGQITEEELEEIIDTLDFKLIWV